LFIPAGVGVMLHVARIAAEWLPILVALLVSTALAITVTALVVDRATAWLIRDDAQP
jgi:holin-like protein